MCVTYMMIYIRPDSLPAQQFDQSGVGATAKCMFLSKKRSKKGPSVWSVTSLLWFSVKKRPGLLPSHFFRGFAESVLRACTCSGLYFPSPLVATQAMIDENGKMLAQRIFAYDIIV